MESDTERSRTDLLRLMTLAQKRPVEQRSDRMFKVIEAMNTDLDPDTLFPSAVRKVVETFQAERGFLILGRDPDSLRFQTAAAFDGRSIECPEEEISHAVIREVAAERKPVLVANALDDDRFLAVSSVLRLELLSVMCSPLIVEDELLGVVYLDNRVLPGAFDQKDLDLLSLFAGHAAIAIRNAQLFEDLRQTRDALLQAERLKAVGQLAASIVHEIKAPITAMRIMADEVANRLDDPDFLTSFAEILAEEIERLNKVVEGLLEYARPSRLEISDTDVAEVLKTTVALLTAEAAQAGIEIVERYDADLPLIQADGEKLKQVFCNLLQNALDAAANAATKRASVSVEKQGESDVVVRVTDTGQGIPAEARDMLFQPFVSTKRGGTGLGLVVSAKIVSEHGGTIAGRNHPDGGAEFTVGLSVRGVKSAAM